MQLDYSMMLDNVKRRRYDEAIRDHVLSASFHHENLAKSVRYALESMREIDSAYAYKVYANAGRITETIEKELIDRGINAAIRYQGALRTETHIRLYGEVDMLCILDDSASHKDVFSLGQIIRDNTSKQNLQSTDYGDGVRISLVTQKPVCKINLIPCSWINNPQFAETRNEIYRAIAVYNFRDKTRKKHLPFLNMARITSKDNATKGNYKRLIRFFRSLCVDDSISLNNYEIAGLLYGYEDENWVTENEQYLRLLPGLKSHLDSVLSDRESFELLLSPSEKELVFGKNSEKMEAVKKLTESLSVLITDLKENMGENLDATINYSSEDTTHSESE